MLPRMTVAYPAQPELAVAVHLPRYDHIGAVILPLDLCRTSRFEWVQTARSKGAQPQKTPSNGHSPALPMAKPPVHAQAMLLTT